MAYRIGGYRLRRYMRANLIKSVNSHECLCETLRLIYDDIHDMKDEEKKERMIDNLVNGMVMAKNVFNRLAYYKEKYKDKSGHGGSSLKRIPNSLTRRTMRQNR